MVAVPVATWLRIVCDRSRHAKGVVVAVVLLVATGLAQYKSQWGCKPHSRAGAAGDWAEQGSALEHRGP
jgi:hypothetical protein